MDQDVRKEIKASLQLVLENLSAAMQGAFPAGDRSRDERAPADIIEKAGLEHDRDVLRLIQNRQRRLAWQISKTLERIEDDEFGICEECGDPIGLERLKAQPTTTTCIDCQRRLELAHRKTLLTTHWNPIEQLLDEESGIHHRRF